MQLDGGLMSNNPTLDLLTEVSECNEARKHVRDDHLMEEPGSILPKHV